MVQNRRGSLLSATFQGDPRVGPPQQGGPVDEEQSDEQNALKILLVQIRSKKKFWKKGFVPAFCFSEDLHSTSAIFSASCAPHSGAHVY